MKFRAGFAAERLARDLAHDPVAHAVQVHPVLHVGVPEQLDRRIGVAGDAAGVGEQLVQRHPLQARIHRVRELRIGLARGVPAQLAGLHHHAGEQRGHRLGVGADMEAVVDGDLDVLVEPSLADGAGGDDIALVHHGGGQRGEFVPRKVGPQRVVQRLDVAGLQRVPLVDQIAERFVHGVVGV